MFKKGDILSITFRNGYDSQGNPIMMTIDRAEVLDCGNGLLQVAYRDVDSSHSDVEIDRIVFNISTSETLMDQCRTG
jgi:hypothetical protein